MFLSRLIFMLQISSSGRRSSTSNYSPGWLGWSSRFSYRFESNANLRHRTEIINTSVHEACNFKQRWILTNLIACSIQTNAITLMASTRECLWTCPYFFTNVQSNTLNILKNKTLHYIDFTVTKPFVSLWRINWKRG